MGSPEQQQYNVEDKLLERVLQELQTYERDVDSETSIRINKLFGVLLQDSLNLQGCSREEFTKALDLEREFTDALLDGWFPVSEIEDDFLEELASFVGQSVDIFKAILQLQDRARRVNNHPDSINRPTPKPCGDPPANHPQAFLKRTQLGNSI
jgi:hypothetical protein